MGNPLKKIFSGVAKVFRKIGRGIKKVAKKVGSFVGRLGIVGQLGMFMLMPHIGSWIWKGMLKMAPGVLGTGAAAATGTAAAGTTAQAGLTAASKFTLKNVGKLAASYSEGNIAQRAVGLVLKGAEMTGKAFTSITSQIDKGVNWVQDTGAKIFGKGNEAKMLTDDAISAGKTLMESGQEGIFPSSISTYQAQSPYMKGGPLDTAMSSIPSKPTVPSGPFLTPAQSAELAGLEKYIFKTGAAEKTKKTLGDKIGQKAIDAGKAFIAGGFEEGINPIVEEDDNGKYVVDPFITPDLTVARQGDLMGKYPYSMQRPVMQEALQHIWSLEQDPYFKYFPRSTA